MRRRWARARGSLLWSQALASLLAVGATGGIAGATVSQLTSPSPAVAAPTADDRGGDTPPLYGEPPPATVYLPETRPVPWTTGSPAGVDGPGVFGPPLSTAYAIPGRVLAAYRGAVRTLAATQPGCGLDVALLAAIGRVESDHARGGDLDATGRTRSPILGPQLDGGPGVMAIRDTDGGFYDGDPVWDRAVGPAQFLPSSWRRWGTDGNGDGVADPSQVDDAWLAAGRYLCEAGGDLRGPDNLRRAILAYNHSEGYLRLVLSWMRVYSGHIVPSTAGAPDGMPSAVHDQPSAQPKGRRSQQPGSRPANPAPSRPPAGKDSSGSPKPSDPPEPSRPEPSPSRRLPLPPVPTSPPEDSSLGGLTSP
ncbi:lytic murein transglycosylase [Streptomyces sp. NPDC052107]|uniref:lytic transglycosylase domain-containing protein n=1 Tax=Streptomyces sp. NPDC052107 TaxID=3155632 RepID=UPI003448E231